MIKGQIKNIYGYACSAIPLVSNENSYYFLGMFDEDQLPGRWENAASIFDYIKQMIEENKNPSSYNNYSKYCNEI